MHFLEWEYLNSDYNFIEIFPTGPSNNIPSLFPIMAWRRPGDKPLSEPMMVRFPTHICVTRPQWVNYPLDNRFWSKMPHMFCSKRCSVTRNIFLGYYWLQIFYSKWNISCSLRYTIFHTYPDQGFTPHKNAALICQIKFVNYQRKISFIKSVKRSHDNSGC